MKRLKSRFLEKVFFSLVLLCTNSFVFGKIFLVLGTNDYSFSKHILNLDGNDIRSKLSRLEDLGATIREYNTLSEMHMGLHGKYYVKKDYVIFTSNIKLHTLYNNITIFAMHGLSANKIYKNGRIFTNVGLGVIENAIRKENKVTEKPNRKKSKYRKLIDSVYADISVDNNEEKLILSLVKKYTKKKQFQKLQYLLANLQIKAVRSGNKNYYVKISKIAQDKNIGDDPWNLSNSKGCTAMHHAAQMSMNGILRTIVAKAKNVDPEDQVGVTPLMLGMRVGNTKGSKILLKNGAKINKRYGDSKYTPLVISQTPSKRFNRGLEFSYEVTKDFLDQNAHLKCQHAIKVSKQSSEFNNARKLIANKIRELLTSAKIKINSTSLNKYQIDLFCKFVLAKRINDNLAIDNIVKEINNLLSDPRLLNEKIQFKSYLKELKINEIEQRTYGYNIFNII